MDWLDKMNAAMEYIEDHLTGDIDYKKIARKARCSEYHFRRMFPFITGFPLSEYIRRRRLYLAASELYNNGSSVSDIAKKYGYNSPDAFTRAFKNWHGITPTEVQKGGQSVKAGPKGLLQASTHFDEGRMEEKGGLDHYIGVAADQYEEDEFATLNVPASDWAVFEIEDSSTEKIQNRWGRIFSEWLPEANYELSEGPEILWNGQVEKASTEQRSEIWIPVKKKPLNEERTLQALYSLPCKTSHNVAY